MTHKERVHAALKRRTVNRVPMWMWYHPYIYEQLRACFGWDADTADESLGNDSSSKSISV